MTESRSESNPHGSDPAAGPSVSGWSPSPGELVAIAVFLALSVLVLAIIFVRIQTESMLWSGAIGGPFEDTMQYLAWIRQAADHLLAGNMFTLAPIERDYLHPGVAISGGLHRLGLSIPVSYAVWVPVASISICVGAFLFVGLIVDAGPKRLLALVFALFFAFPLPFVDGLLPRLGGQMFTLVANDAAALTALRGYPYSALAIGLACLALVRFVKVRARGIPIDPWLILLTLLAGWLQPWQAFTLAATVIAAEAVSATPRFRLRPDLTGSRATRILGLSVLAAAAVPMAYYFLLGRLDASWAAAEANLVLAARAESWWMPLLAMAPLGLVALAALRVPVMTVADLAARLWPAVAIGEAIALGLVGMGNPSHALRGCAIPLGVLAVVGGARLLSGVPRPLVIAISTIAVVVACGVGTVDGTSTAVRGVTQSGTLAAEVAGSWLSQSEKSILGWLDDGAGPGPVLGGRERVNSVIPWWTGRQVWAGHTTWTPNSQGRFDAVSVISWGVPCCSPRLLLMEPSRFITSTGARFIVLHCWEPRRKVLAQLRPATVATKSSPCVTAVRVRPTNNEADRRLVERFYGH